ncbi:Gfo/Idh/MocA family protein [Actinokineospora cianjurensis]|uniref:Putative dehydrogenase n=1 Tax=Actinokineospora cianjurensis TaxID=585224 RepID=A0A421AWL2_9PSEU|nr:Gfo/Idh/MocA family oxidoreductase [Actinokineospora cianjurensis]RLK53977.1 putative dehydrogenase [Actinokineospora cianjurensis]
MTRAVGSRGAGRAVGDGAAAAVRIGVLGCADIALRRMLPAFAAGGGVELTAIASRDPVKAAEQAGRYGVRALPGYAELLDLDDVEAVYVPLPAGLHAEWVAAALRAGKHVLAEKPLTTDVALTEALLDEAAARGLVLMENVMFVHHARHAEVRRLVAAGAIGEPRSLHAAFAVPTRTDGDIRYRPELGGGALWDVGVYPVRAALHLLGADLRVAGAVLSAGPGREVDTSGAALLATASGVTAQLTFGIEDAYTSAYQVRGSEGHITVDRAFTPAADHVPTLRVTHGSVVRELRLAPDDQVGNTVGAFARAVRSGVFHDPDCLRQARLLHAVRVAATTEGLTSI